MSSEGMQSWKKLKLGCAIYDVGSSSQFRTGDWRSSYPVIDKEKCIKCGRCYILCPDMCYSPNPEVDGEYIWNDFYCKGCGICIYECPNKAIAWGSNLEQELEREEDVQ